MEDACLWHLWTYENYRKWHKLVCEQVTCTTFAIFWHQIIKWKKIQIYLFMTLKVIQAEIQVSTFPCLEKVLTMMSYTKILSSFFLKVITK